MTLAAVSCHAVIDDRNDETEMDICELESACPIVTTKDTQDLSRLLLSRPTMMHMVLLGSWMLMCSVLRRTCKGSYIKRNEANVGN